MFSESCVRVIIQIVEIISIMRNPGGTENTEKEQHPQFIGQIAYPY